MKKLLKFCLLTFVLLSDFVGFAQGGPDEGDDPIHAPINSKIVLLAAAGVLFVFYTLRKNKRTINP